MNIMLAVEISNHDSVESRSIRYSVCRKEEDYYKSQVRYQIQGTRLHLTEETESLEPLRPHATRMGVKLSTNPFIQRGVISAMEMLMACGVVLFAAGVKEATRNSTKTTCGEIRRNDCQEKGAQLTC
ncbi:hypothetical protein J3458_020601 [Metarhizium acridum]|uniref:uncharacterized protein n=1 Tax=Metarhizium acridum TaxID=92637 RepID=UPI001C6B160C|nr:hypothetical protein J3458_020601 [Metarhizium acridum]